MKAPMVSDSLLFVLFVLAGVGSGLIGGVFFAFSSFMMRALASLPGAEGIRAMQSINVKVIHPLFLVPFLGTGLLAVVSVVAAGLRMEAAESLPAIAAGVLYAFGCIGVTLVCNVPLNDELAKVNAESESGVAMWDRYLRVWVRWNHVRTTCCLLAVILYIVALRRI